MIKTISVNGLSEIKLSDEPYFYKSEKYAWIKNKSADEMYASSDNENFIEIPAGLSGRIEIFRGNKIFLDGSGDAEIHTSDAAVCPFRSIGTGGGSAVLGTKSISRNGTYNAADDAFDGYSRVTVDVSSSINLQELTISETGTYTPDPGYDGFSKITVQSGDEVLQYATVGFKVHMGNNPFTSSYAGKWIVIDLYIDGELCLSRAPGAYLEYESDHFDSVTFRSASADTYSMTCRLDVTGAFHKDGEGRKTNYTVGSVFYDNDIATPPISTIAQARAAVNAGKFVIVIDV